MSNPTMTIAELEFSVTAACSLACAECGFFVPHQPAPTFLPAAEELRHGLACLEAAGVEVGSIAIVGGEATLAPAALAAVLEVARLATNLHRVELVTNGLTPKGLPPSSLDFIDRLSLSDYTADEALCEAWRVWLAKHAPHIRIRPAATRPLGRNAAGGRFGRDRRAGGIRQLLVSEALRHDRARPLVRLFANPEVATRCRGIATHRLDDAGRHSGLFAGCCRSRLVSHMHPDGRSAHRRARRATGRQNRTTA